MEFGEAAIGKPAHDVVVDRLTTLGRAKLQQSVFGFYFVRDM
jgi:hypothetical protein